VDISGVFFVLLVIFLVLLAMWLHTGRSKALLSRWADSNGFRILQAKYLFFKGPYFWTSSRGQTVYYVTVESAAGRPRTGWVRCGGWWFGLLSDKAEVRWEN
jgi:hypothetical protein